jgi:hypothetical protein
LILEEFRSSHLLSVLLVVLGFSVYGGERRLEFLEEKNEKKKKKTGKGNIYDDDDDGEDDEERDKKKTEDVIRSAFESELNIKFNYDLAVNTPYGKMYTGSVVKMQV